MSTASGEQRIRRPKSREDLVQKLLTSGEGPFRTRAEVLTFAAAVGWSRKRREPFTDFAEPIRYGVFHNSSGTVSAFIDALGVLDDPDDPSILSESRLGERIAAFEEYANGGLAVIQGELNASKARTEDVLLEMTRKASQEQLKVAGDGLELPDEIGRLLGPATWDVASTSAEEDTSEG